jgi:hypothetical protein
MLPHDHARQLALAQARSLAWFCWLDWYNARAREIAAMAGAPLKDWKVANGAAGCERKAAPCNCTRQERSTCMHRKAEPPKPGPAAPRTEE